MFIAILLVITIHFKLIALIASQIFFTNFSDLKMEGKENAAIIQDALRHREVAD